MPSNVCSRRSKQPPYPSTVSILRSEPAGQKHPASQADYGGATLHADYSPEVGPLCTPISSRQQQVRNLWTNIGVWHLNLWMHTLTELWAWRRSKQQLVRRDDSPWDCHDRRPSHAGRRKALQAVYLAKEFSSTLLPQPFNKKFRDLLKRLLRIAV